MCVVGTAQAAILAIPSSFAPTFDGESGATQLTWDVPNSTHVVVSIADVSGRDRTTLVDENETMGSHSAWWDGRDDAGDALPAGRWIVSVTFPDLVAPVLTRNHQHSAHSFARGAQLNVAGATTVIAIENAPVAISSMRVLRGAIGANATHRLVVGHFALSGAATVAAAVVDSSGHIVRSLHSGIAPASGATITWDGRSASGAAVADGAYTLLVAASGSGRPSDTARMPLRVDRHAPVVTGAFGPGTVVHGAALLPLAVTVNEPSTVAVRLGVHHISWRQVAGTKTVRLLGRTLGLAPGRHARGVRIALRAADATGNLRTQVISLVVPARSATRVTTPPAQSVPTVTPPPPPATGGSATVAGLRWPIDGSILITSPFGQRNRDFHVGIDINAAIGTRVYAVADGSVLSAGTMSGYGTQVTLQNAGPLSTRYAHLSQVAPGLVAGDHVSKGQLIGLSGCTGTCTGPHLHFETRINGIAQNPIAYLPAI